MQRNSYSISHLSDWARAMNRPVTVFALHSTSNDPYVVWLGVTELGYITFQPDGETHVQRALVNPEHHVSTGVRRSSNMPEAQLAQQPTWAAWASTFHAMASEHVMVGFNSHAFDCVVVQLQNARHGVPSTRFAHSLDARALPDVSGTLSQVADELGIRSENAQHALDDAWLIARVVDAVAARHGLVALDTSVGMCPAWSHIADPARWSRHGQRAIREADILTHYAQYGVLPDLDMLAAKHGMQRSIVENDVYRLSELGKLPSALFDRPEVQEFLGAQLAQAIATTWTGDAVGRLKPLFMHLAPSAPVGFDYTQLRIALARHKATRHNAA